MVGRQETTAFFEKMGIAPVPPTLYLHSWFGRPQKAAEEKT